MAAQKTEAAAKAAMLIRKPVHEVFEAMVDPDITSQFWYSKGSGRLDREKKVEWTWEVYGVAAAVNVEQVIPDSSISFSWGDADNITRVRITFEPKGDNATFVSVQETGWNADTENLIDLVVGQTEGWSLVMASMKAYLEQGVRIKVVEDRFPG